MTNKHLYLFTLEIAPLAVGKIYNPLPSHLTLMSRFWSDLHPSELAVIVEPLFNQTPPIELTFGQSAQLGPNKIDAHLLEPSEQLKALHNELRQLLDSIHVVYEYPQFVGEGHKPHVSKRAGNNLTPGHKQISRAAYLIEVEVKGKEHLRYICAKFNLNS